MFLFILGAAIAATQPSRGATFEAIGGGIISGEATQATWQQVPTAESLGTVFWSQLPHEATLQATCTPQANGTLQDCRISETLPARLKESDIGDRLLQQLKLSRDSAETFQGRTIYVSIWMRNPAGTDENISYCGDPFCTSIPPPPPVLVAETAPIKAALDEASKCLWGPPGSVDYSGQSAAERATRQLQAPVGSAEWKKARDSVAFFAQRRQEQRQCLVHLETLRREGSMTIQDRKALTYHQKGLVLTWVQRGLHEATALRRLLGIPSSDLDPYLPSNLLP